MFNKLSKIRSKAFKDTQIYRNFCQKNEPNIPKRGILRPAYNISINDNVSGFQVKEIKKFQDFNMKMYVLQHQELGTKVIHFDCEDTNNAFVFTFKTFSEDHKGKAHILEHLITCGSEKYPVRDPFMAMTKRSLNSYMNAWTGSDFTSYPFSTVNHQDFQNLLEVYCDMVFKPTLNYYDFLQEAWRLELLDNTDADSPLIYNGVIFNEMKGVTEDSQQMFMETMESLVLAGTPYQYISGGLPESMITLSYQELMEYYKKYYHPSNCTIFSYGDLDFRNNLKYIDENYYGLFQKKTNDFEHLSIDKIDFPKKQTNFKISIPPNSQIIDQNRQSIFGLGFYIKDMKLDTSDIVGIGLLNFQLFESPKSPFYKNFLESGKASGYCPGYGLEQSIRHGYFVIGFDSVSIEDAETLEKEILDTLSKIVQKGFSESLIEAALHQIEVNNKIPGGNFGLFMFESLVASINHDIPELIDANLNITENLEEIREKIEYGGYFQDLITKYFIDNPNKVTLTAIPDNSYIDKKDSAEIISLNELKKVLTNEDIESIVKDSVGLQAEQEKLQDFSVLPSLKVSDVEIREPIIKDEKFTINGVDVTYFTHCPEGITFLQLKFDTKYIDDELMKFLFIYERFLPQLGTKTFKYDEFAELIFLNTGRFSLNVRTQANPKNVNDQNGFLQLTMACLDRNIETMFNLMTEIIAEPDFSDYQTLSKLVRLESSDLASNFSSSSYCINQSQAALSAPLAKYNSFANMRFLCDYGTKFLSSILNMKNLCGSLENNLINLLKQLVKRDCLEIAVHSSRRNKEYVKLRVDVMTNTMSHVFPDWDQKSIQKKNNVFEKYFAKEFFVLPKQVNYVSETYSVPNYLDPDTAKLNILSEILSNGPLHSIIREKGGAYGAYCEQDDLNGLMTFSSYRDPKNLETFTSFEKCIFQQHEGKFKDSELDEAKLSLFAKLDTPLPSQTKGMSKWYSKIDFEDWQNYRKQLLDVSRDDLKDVIEKHLINSLKKDQTSKVIFGTIKKDELEGQVERGWNVERFVEQLSLNQENYSDESDMMLSENEGEDDGCFIRKF